MEWKWRESRVTINVLGLRVETFDVVNVITRRKAMSVVAVSGVSVLAGCGMFDNQPDVVVFNRTSSEVNADVTLRDGDQESLVSETATISVDDGYEIDDVLPESGTVAFQVAVEGGPSDEQEFEVSEDVSLQARIEDGGIEFDEV